MKRNMTVKIFAFLALFWIIVSVIWTWIIFFMWSSYNKEITTQEQPVFDVNNIKTWTWKIEK